MDIQHTVGGCGGCSCRLLGGLPGDCYEPAGPLHCHQPRFTAWRNVSHLCYTLVWMLWCHPMYPPGLSGYSPYPNPLLPLAPGSWSQAVAVTPLASWATAPLACRMCYMSGPRNGASLLDLLTLGWSTAPLVLKSLESRGVQGCARGVQAVSFECVCRCADFNVPQR